MSLESLLLAFCSVFSWTQAQMLIINLEDFVQEMLPPPHIIAIIPTENSVFISPKSSITVIWSEPVTEDSFFEHLRITPDLPKTEGRKMEITWDRTADPRTFHITFSPHLPEKEHIVLTILPGAESLTTHKKSTEKFTSSFATRSKETLLHELMEIYRIRHPE